MGRCSSSSGRTAFDKQKAEELAERIAEQDAARACNVSHWQPGQRALRRNQTPPAMSDDHC